MKNLLHRYSPHGKSFQTGIDIVAVTFIGGGNQSMTLVSYNSIGKTMLELAGE
jgi:hypothetical protein